MSRIITTPLTTRWPALLGAMILVYGLTLAAFSREGFPESMDYGFGMPYLSDRPVGEDAFYMLTVAWNIAEEGHIVYNLHKPTTGIQPLATVVYAALARVIQFLGGDKWALVRAVIGLNVLLLVLFARQLGRIAAAAMVRPDGRELADALAMVTTLSSVWVFRVFTYGLETGIYLVLLAAMVLMTLRDDRPIAAGWFGVLGGLTGLARIDYGLIFALQILFLLRQRRLRLTGAISAGVIALIVTLPWFLWVHGQTGSWMPSSGGAQSGWINALDSHQRLWRMATALVWNMTPWISSYDNDMRFRWAAVALTVFLGLTLPAFYESLKAGRPLLNRRQLGVLLTWGICIAVLIPVYLVGFRAWHFYGRYMAPLIVVTFPFIAVLATVATSRFKSVGFSLLGLSPLGFAALAASQMHSGHMILDLPINAGFVRAHLDDRRLVGAFQSGTVGYFNGRVVNLDGKIDFRAQYAMSQGGIRAYIDDQQIDVLLDWPQLCELFGDGVSPEEWTACNQQPGGMSRCCERKRSIASRSFTSAKDASK